ncbi:hypothetical protein BGX21_008070 [Mortierella sp. AD011]|nr:hypothetical protein BGX20_007091 [Mortierella sp. AD010]KAF9398202.1 hypothetical protein BGX21_008070 [Mortierella sp. AD011]
MNQSSESNGNGDSTKKNDNQQKEDSEKNSSNPTQEKTQQQLDDEAAAEAKKKRAGPKRRKVTHGRPCQRCIKRNIGHLCHDEPKPSASAAASNQQSNSTNSSHTGTPAPNAGLSRTPEARRTPQQQQQQAQAQQQQFNQQLAQGLQQQQLHNNNLGNMALYGFNSQLAALPVTPLTFASEHMGNEFTVISDFLESLGGDHHNVFQDAAGIPVNTTEKFFLTAADPSDGTNEDRLTQVINAKFEAGFLKPYNYVNGYSRLQRYMDSNMSNISRQRILNVMGTFRPAFRTVAQSLTDIDLVLVEEAFERLLLDYDRVFSSMGIPACLWRRTGEIYKGNKEFASLVNVPLEMLREGRLCIYELMAEESAVNYWEKYGNIAFDAGQKAVLTSCLLKNPDPDSQNVISCCFSFTIRRDKYNIPTVIVGNFLPVSLG